MPYALLLSSFVAANRIGAAAQQYVLAAHGIDPILVPTVLLGRSPAKGSKGEATGAELFGRMLEDVEAEGLFGRLDLVVTGHFSSADQVRLAAEALDRIRGAGGRRPVVVVDPILGDAPKGLYVKPEVAEAVAARLVPLADWITPNLWELGYLAGGEVDGAAAAIAAARRLGKPALITSAPAEAGEIGLILVGPEAATLFAHPKLPQAPNGAGDLIAASFGAGLAEGLSPLAAAERAARAAYEAVQAAQEDGRVSDLPIVALGPRLVRPTAPVRIERL